MRGVFLGTRAPVLAPAPARYFFLAGRTLVRRTLVRAGLLRTQPELGA